MKNINEIKYPLYDVELQLLHNELLTKKINHKIIELLLRIIEQNNNLSIDDLKLKFFIEKHDDDFYDLQLLLINNLNNAIENKFAKFQLIKGVSLNDYENSRCISKFLNTFQVHSSVSHSIQPLGVGPIFYDLCLEIASKFGGGIRTGGASKLAYAVWEKYYNFRNDVDKENYDLDIKVLAGQKKQNRFQDVQNDYLLTPQTDDDCELDFEVFDRFNIANKLDYINSPLTKIYFLKNKSTNLIKSLYDIDILILKGMTINEFK